MKGARINMGNLKFIFHRFLILCFMSFCFSYENPFINQQSDNMLHKVEVGINSISQISNDEYIISVYAINPYNPIAGIQFKIQPSDLFEVIEVYGGKSQEKDFEIHFNKTGTILGFSMVANTIDPSIIVTGPTRLDSNILLEIKVKSNQLDSYDINSEINFDCVFASKKGEVLETKFIPFKLSDIDKN